MNKITENLQEHGRSYVLGAVALVAIVAIVAISVGVLSKDKEQEDPNLIGYDGNIISASGGISDVVDDTTPTLGGDLDAGNFDITNITNLVAINVSTTESDTSGNAIFSGTMEIPNAADPTVNVQGQCALDTTTSSVTCFNAAQFTLYAQDAPKAFTISSTTLNNFAGLTNSSTIGIGFSSPEGETWDALTCITDAGTAEIEFGDGTNFMDYQLITSSALTDSSMATNNTFGMREERVVRVGQVAGGMNYLSCSVEITRNVN